MTAEPDGGSGAESTGGNSGAESTSGKTPDDHGEDPGRFRAAMASLAGGVTVLTCRVDGSDHAMTATAVTSVSLHPPLVLVCVSRTSRFWEAVSRCGHWGLSILDETAQPHAAWLATKGRPLSEQLAEVPHRRGEHGYALIEASLAWLECRTIQQVRAGDHDIIIGEVEHAESGPGTSPLIYWRSRYRAASELKSAGPGERYS